MYVKGTRPRIIQLDPHTQHAIDSMENTELLSHSVLNSKQCLRETYFSSKMMIVEMHAAHSLVSQELNHAHLQYSFGETFL
jgi:hypothetical protein